jgi:predicted O-methyltransferase YrrM
MTSHALSTRIKLQINGLLRPVGLHIGTTSELKAEQTRIQRLEATGHWDNAKYGEGLRFAPKEYLTFLRENCLPYKDRYSAFPKVSSGKPNEFYLDNGYFRSVDAELLYSIIRKRRPKHIVEVGSGFSTRLMAQALEDEKLSTTITSIDPSPRIDVKGSASKHIRSCAEELDPGVIVESLEEGDLLFIDSSHDIVTGGDIPYLFLEVLPKLKRGVLIHVHDIFFPFDYPQEWTLEGWDWNEQYLVHAFLAFNEVFRILWPARYMWGYYQRDVLEVIPADPHVFPPSSLWIEKTA